MEKDAIAQLLRQLVTVDGPAGDEGRVQKLVQTLCAPYAAEVRVDTMGSVIAYRAGAAAAPGRLMLAAHLDEIGLTVTKVEGSYLHVIQIGGVDPRSLVGQEVTVYPSGSGSERYPQGLPGYVGSRPPHVMTPEERDTAPTLQDLRVDTGRPVDGLVNVGDRIAVRGPYTELLGGRIASKALDNRASVAAMIGALAYLAGMQHTWDVYAVATVGEEIGYKGATPAAFALEPDLALAIDVTHADTPGVDDTETVPWNEGPAIDWGPNLHPGIVKRLRNTAEALEMSFVTETAPGPSGTDAWAIQMAQSGIPCGLVSIPVRYMHSAVEMVTLADIDRTARLLAAFISQLDDQFLATLPEEV
jgi:tetrahedral aminopeptidase